MTNDTPYPSKEEIERKLLHRFYKIASAIGFQKDAQDIAQEAFLIRLKYPDHRQSAYHTVIDAIRNIKGRVDSTHELKPLTKAISTEVIGEVIAPAVNAVCHFTDSEIIALLDTLNPRERAFIVLKHVWEFRNEEIGYCFGIKKSSTEVEMYKIYEKLRDEFSKKKSHNTEKTIGETTCQKNTEQKS